MELNEYQKEIKQKKEITSIGGLLYGTLNLSSKCGNFVENIKKIIEEKNGKINPEDKSELVKSLGNVLATVSQIADELFITLEDVSLMSIQNRQIQLKKDAEQ